MNFYLSLSQDIDARGWIPLTSLLHAIRRPKQPHPTVADVVQVVECNDKKRFVLEGLGHDDDGELLTSNVRIRAAQGHSYQLDAPILEELTLERIFGDGNKIIAIHGTSRESWERIQQSGELRRMNRTHIHFSLDPRHLRKGSQVLLQLNVEQALQSHPTLRLFKSTNNVLLTEGPIPLADNGLIKEVSRDSLPHIWQVG